VRLIAVTVAAAAVVTGVVVAAELPRAQHPAPVAAGAPSPHPTSAPSSRPTAGPTPAPSSAPGLAADTLTPKAATAVVASFATAVDHLSPTSGTAALDKVVTGAALQEVQAQQLEFKTNGWTATGTTRVTGVKVLRDTTVQRTRTVEVQACVDSSKVRLLNASGKPAFAGTPTMQRALNLYTLQLGTGGWRIVRHSFPTDPTC